MVKILPLWCVLFVFSTYYISRFILKTLKSYNVPMCLIKFAKEFHYPQKKKKERGKNCHDCVLTVTLLAWLKSKGIHSVFRFSCVCFPCGLEQYCIHLISVLYILLARYLCHHNMFYSLVTSAAQQEAPVCTVQAIYG